MLERELGITQSSIYNAFGSKQNLLDRALDRYVARIDSEVLAPLNAPEANDKDLLAFVDRLMVWISNPEQPGCLLLNLLGETKTSDPALVERARAYRDRLRQVFQGALASHGEAEAAQRAEVMLASVLGINISAYGGASPEELTMLANGLRSQLTEWAKA